MNVFRKPQDNERNLHASLYVGNLDAQVSEPLLYELFIQVGPVKLLNLPKDRILREHQGFGFVEFRTVEDAEYALNILRGIRLFGRLVKMKKTDPQSSSTPTVETAARPKMSVGARLFINNLNDLVDENYLLETFSKFGELLEKPTISRDETGKSKGHGFIEYVDFESSDRALEQMDGSILMNNKVALQYAYKEGLEHKKMRHGDLAERLLSLQGKQNLKVGKKNKLRRR